MTARASEKPDESRPSNPLLLTDAPAGLPNEDDNGVQNVAVGAESVQLDHLGPMTISRISNWDKLTEPERSRTIRLVTQRNALRVQKLKDQQQESDEKPTAANQNDPNQAPRNEL